MKPINEIITRHGMGSNGYVQMFLTATINRYMGQYMPHVTGTLESKQKHIASATSIEVISPAAKYLYFGKKMVDSKTGKGPAFIKDVGFRYRKGATLVPTAEPLRYDRTHNPKAGPYWDRRMMAEKQAAIIDEVEGYIRRTGV